MKQYLLILGLSGCLLITLLSGCFGTTSTETFNQEYSVNDQTVVTVSNINGNVEITGWSGTTVTVNAVKSSNMGKAELDNVNISVTRVGTRLDIETIFKGLSATQASVAMTIKIPYNITLGSVSTSNGGIQISGTKGNSTVSTSNGAILVENVDGYIQASTSNARIEIRGTTGIDGLQTSNGVITAEVRDIRSDTSLDTSNAVITVYLDPFLNASLDIETSNGHVTVSDVTLNNATIAETRVIGVLGSDGHRLDIHTSNANLYVYKLQI